MKKPANTPETRPKRTLPKTAWKKGQPSPNPSGRPKSDAELVEACRARTPTALAVLDRAMKKYLDGEGSHSAATRAAEAVLDRGWGSAPAVVRLEGEATVQVQHEHQVHVAPLDAQRLQRVAMLLERVGVLEQLREVKRLDADGVVVEAVQTPTQDEEEAT